MNPALSIRLCISATIELLQLSEANDWLVEEVLLIDPEEIDEAEQIPSEIVSASKAVLRLEPNNMENVAAGRELYD